MENIEYNDMAIFYDMFYKNKDYKKEIEFINNIIGNRENILDVGCGTGIHMHLLEAIGKNVDGLDLNDGMLKIAETRINGTLYEDNLLTYRINKKYDAIISMFAVFNHLKNIKEFEIGILNSLSHLNNDGILIVDLHNGRSSGSKEDTYENYKRKMTWEYNNFHEHTDIEYTVDNKTYKTSHDFIILDINSIKSVLDKNNLNYKLFENYSMNEASDNSKNIEIVIYK